jgi:diguanylate cyclase (GGDEF)-like protein
MNHFFTKLNNLPKWFLIILAYVLIIIIGYIDYLLSFKISFSLFYLLSITLVSYYVSQKQGILLSLLSAIIWITSDILSGHEYFNYIIPFWNTLIRLGFFLIYSILIFNLKKANDNLKKYAEEDSLTGSFNSRIFYQFLKVELDRSKRFQYPLSLAYIDLDNFKMVNDTKGHNEGDRVLKLIVQVIKKNTRKSDIISRLGGDEFAILLPQTDGNHAYAVIRKIKDILFKTMLENHYSVTFSIGLVTYTQMPDNVSEIIQKADTLMYEVKRSGKNNIKHQIN